MIYALILIGLLLIGAATFVPGYYQLQFKGKKWSYSLKPVEYVNILLSPIPKELLLKILAFAESKKQVISIKELTLYHKFNVDIEKAFATFKEIRQAGLRITDNVSADYLRILQFALKGGSLDDLSFAMLKAADAGILLTVDEVLDYVSAKGNVAKAVELLIESKNVGKEMMFKDLTEHLNKGGNVEKDVNVAIKLFRANLTVSLNEIRRFSLERDVDSLMKIMIKTANNNQDLTIDELLAFPNNLNLEQAVEVLIELKRAGIPSSLKELEMYSHVRDMKELVDIMALINSQSIGLDITFEHIKVFPPKEDLAKAITLLIKSRQAGIDMALDDLTRHLTVGGDIEKLVIAAIKAKEEKLDISVEELKSFYHVSKSTGGCDVDTAVEMLIKTSSQGIPLTLTDMRRHIAQKGDVEKLVKALIISHHENLNVSLLDLELHFHQGGDVEQFVIALRISAHEELGFTKEKLLKLHNNNAHVLDLIRALRSNKRENLGIPLHDIEKVYSEGLDVLKIIFAVLNARHSGLNVGFDYAVAIERSEIIGIEMAIKWALYPQTKDVPTIRMVAKDGIELIIDPKVKILGKIDQFFSGAREDVTFDRVSSAIINQAIKYTTHKEIRENRDAIAKHAFRQLESEDAINKNSALDILDILIPKISLGNDTNEEIRRRKAELDKQIAELDAEKRNIMIPVLEKEAQIKLTLEQADKEKNIGIAFRDGTMNTKEYYKYLTNQK